MTFNLLVCFWPAFHFFKSLTVHVVLPVEDVEHEVVVSVSLNSPCSVYWVLQRRDCQACGAPSSITSSDVRAGQMQGGAAAEQKGTIPVPSTSASAVKFTIKGLLLRKA